MDEVKRRLVVERLNALNKMCREGVIDAEEAHRKADAILMIVLHDFKCYDVINAFFRIPKWYS